MNLESQVVVVSIFGRGHWMAAELARKSIPVLLLDVSKQMGPWKNEDVTGPFGFFKTEDLSPLQKERLFESHQPQLVPQGLTLWLKSGPFELKGPTTEHRMKALGIPQEVADYIAEKKSDSTILNQLKKLSFEKNWLAQLSHQFLSTVSSPAVEAYRTSVKVPLFSSYYVNSSQETSTMNFQWCENQGVKILKAEICDVAFTDKKTISGFEIKTEQANSVIQILKMQEVVWCLTSEETSMLGKKILESLFSEEAITPEWSWVRFQVKVKDLSSQSALIKEQIPLESLVIEDLNLPWTHENFIVLQKRETDLFNVWIRIPTQQRFQKQYLDQVGQGVLHVLNDRIHDNEVVISESPLELAETFSTIGPARFPLFSNEDIQKIRRRALGNVAWDGPECWKSYHVQSIFESQGAIVKELTQWWERKEELRKKQEEKQKMKEKRAEL